MRATRRIWRHCSRMPRSSSAISGATTFRPPLGCACCNRWQAGLDQIDLDAVPKGVTVCNVFGHEPAIAEYVIMTMLVLMHQLFETVTAFRAGSWAASPTFGGSS